MVLWKSSWVALFLFLISHISYTQCTTPSYTASYCEGQRAEITITDNDPNNVYHWFRNGDLYDLGYGVTGDGKSFVSPTDITGVNTVDFWVSKERPELIGPAGTIPATGGTDAPLTSADYEMTFTAQSDFKLNAVTIKSRVDYADPSKMWGFAVRIVPLADVADPTKGQYSNWLSYKFTTNALETIEIPVGLNVTAGTNYVIQIKSGNATLNLSATNNMYWYPTTSYTSTTYLTAPTQITVNPVSKSIYSSPRYPLIQDWDITVACPKVKITATKRTTGCCTPVGTSFAINSPKAVVEDSDLPLTLTVTGADAVSTRYFMWYDEKKNLLAGGEGIGKTTMQITKAGTYYVRVVESATFKNSFSCYKENSKLVQKRILFAEASKINLCIGETATLIATGATGAVTWSPTTGLSSSTGKTTTVTPTSAGNFTYKASAIVPIGNLVIDGDFDESTRTAPKFETKYNLVDDIPNGSPNNTAVIGTRASALWNSTGRFCDDTVGFYSADRGKFLYADAQSSSIQPTPANWGITNFIWQQSNLPVSPNSAYEFRFLVTDWGTESLTEATKTADIQMYVNGQPMLVTPLEINKRCRWTEVKATWNSGTNTSATLTISDVNAQNIGGEFAIDDISFGAPGIQEDTVTLKVTDCSSVIARADTNVCIGEPVRLTAVTNGMITKWTPSTDLDNTNPASPIARPIANTTYTVEAQFPLTKVFTNPNFTNGNSDITSGLTYSPTGTGPQDNQYGVVYGNEAWLYYPFHKAPDHTSGTGMYMLANVKTGAERTVFTKTISVTSGETIGLSFYLINLHTDLNNAADLNIAIKVGGTIVKRIAIPKDRNWYPTQYTWTAATTGNITFEIVSPQETTDRSRVFGIDDLVLAKLGNPKTDNVLITTKDCFSITATRIGNCQGDSIQIEAETNGLFKGWTVQTGGTAGIVTPNNLTTWVKPTAPTTYVATASFQLGNAITNGDFELGDQGFTSDYTCCLPNGGGRYSVDTDPYIAASGAGWTISKKDHTSGKGKMYLADGGSDPTKAAYKTTVNVVAGKQYAFSAWFANIHSEFLKPNPDTLYSAKSTYLAFYINGGLNNAIKLPIDTAWHQYYTVWTAPSSGTITIEIRNRETSGTGNDFALDDIVFAPLYSIEKTATVAVPACVVCNKPSQVRITNLDTVACVADTLTLQGNYKNLGRIITNPADGMNYVWYKLGGPAPVAADYKALPAPTPVSTTAVLPVGSRSLSPISATSDGKYVLRVQDGKNPSQTGCYTEDTITIIVKKPISNNIIGSPQTICENETLTALRPMVALQGDTVKAPSGVYNWEEATASAGPWTLTNPVATTKTFMPTKTVGTKYFRRIVYAESNACKNDTSLAVSVIVNAVPLPPSAPTISEICAGSATTLAKTSPAATGTYFWYTSATGGNPISNNTSTGNLSASKDYYLIDSVTTTSCKSARVKVTITVNPTPNTGAITPSNAVCEGTTTTYSVPPTTGSTYVWKVDGATQTAFTGNTVDVIAPNTNYTLSVVETSDKNCPGAAKSQSITVDKRPTNAVAGADGPICVAETIKLNGNVATIGTGQWVKAAGSNGTIVDVNDPTSTVTGLADGQKIIAIWQISNGVCPISSDTMTLTGTGVADPTVTVSPDTVCEGSTVNFVSGYTNQGSAPNFTLKNAANDATLLGPNSNGLFSLPNVTTEMDVYVLLESSSSCLSSPAAGIVKSPIKKVVLDRNPTKADITDTDHTICGDKIDLTNTNVSVGTGSWSIKAGDNGNIVKSSATSANATGLVTGSSSKFYFTTSSTLGICAKTKDSVVIASSTPLAIPDVKGQSTTLCISAAAPTLSANPLPPVSAVPAQTGTWASASGTSATINATSGQTAGLVVGANKFVYTIANGGICPELTDTVTIIVDELSTTPVITTNNGNTITMCGSDQQLAINSPVMGKITWTNDKSLPFTDAASDKADTLASTKLDGFTNTTGTVRAIVSVKNGTCPAVSDFIDVIRSGEITSPNLTGDLIVCQGGSIDFTGNLAKATNTEASGWIWSPSTGITIDTSGTNDNTAKFTFASTGNYDVTYTIDNPTCAPKSETLSITVVTPPTASITAPGTVTAGGGSPNPNSVDKIINGSPATLISTAAGTGYTGTWSLVSTTQPVPASQLDPSGDVHSNSIFLLGQTEKEKNSIVRWTVVDDNGKCPAAVANINLIRKDVPDIKCPNDTTICESAALGHLLMGNVPASDEAGIWTPTAGSSAVGATSTNTANVTAFVVGINTFTYTVTSSSLPAPNNVSVCSTKVTVDALTEKPTIDATTTNLTTIIADREYRLTECTDKVAALPGQTPVYSNAMWKKYTIDGGQGTLDNPNSPSSPFSNLTGINQTSVIYWWHKNGVCPADSVKLNVFKPGSVTAPIISVENATAATITPTSPSVAANLCIGSTYKLKGNALNNAGESYSWSTINGNSVLYSGASNVQDPGITLDPLKTGDTTVMRLSINPPAGIPCPFASVDVMLVPHQAPVITSLTGTGTLCEDGEGQYNVAYTNILGTALVNWKDTTISTSRAVVQGIRTQNDATYKFTSTKTSGIFDNASVKVSVSNACGTTYKDLPVTVNLRPKGINVAFSSPITTICGTDAGPVAYTVTVSPSPLANGTSYNWYWNNQKVTTNTIGTFDLTKMLYEPLSGQSIPLQVKLENTCGEATASDNAWSPALNVGIKAAQDLRVDISPKNIVSVCIPENAYTAKTFNASPIGISNPLSTSAKYHFIVRDTVTKQIGLASASTIFNATGLDHNDTVAVVLTDPDGCFTGNRMSDTAFAVIDGYNRPDSAINVSKSIICDYEGDIVLSVPKTKNAAINGTKWYKEGQHLPQWDGKFEIPVGSPEESGMYTVRVKASVCADSSRTEDSASAYVVEVAKITFDAPTVPFLVPYLEVPNVHMPAVISGLTRDTIIRTLYDNPIWLEDPTQPKTLLVPGKEEGPAIPYTLTVTTGKDGIECYANGGITVQYYLPLNIPNAFSPNEDGLNDNWVITGLGKYPGTKVKVFNRWGTAMYVDNNGYRAVWDGNHNGQPLPVGTYYYVIELKGSPDGTDQNVTGSLTLVR